MAKKRRNNKKEAQICVAVGAILLIYALFATTAFPAIVGGILFFGGMFELRPR